jgi:hypothetical protein
MITVMRRMMMKGMSRVALMLGLVAVSAGSIQAAEVRDADDRIDTDIYVVNNHLTDVRVFAEGADGQLYKLGRVPRGQLKNFDVPEAVADGEFRIKVFPTSPLLSPIPDDFGIKTSPLDSETDYQVRIWLEADLTQSIVEVARD